MRRGVRRPTERVHVAAQQEEIQPEAGAREGVLTAKQIDNLSVIGRSALELMRILPGVVRVADAHGEPPNIPFWFGEAPARSDELSQAVSDLRDDADAAPLPAEVLADVRELAAVALAVEERHAAEVRMPSRPFEIRVGQVERTPRVEAFRAQPRERLEQRGHRAPGGGGLVEIECIAIAPDAG